MGARRGAADQRKARVYSTMKANSSLGFLRTRERRVDREHTGRGRHGSYGGKGVFHSDRD